MRARPEVGRHWSMIQVPMISLTCHSKIMCNLQTRLNYIVTIEVSQPRSERSNIDTLGFGPLHTQHHPPIKMPAAPRRRNRKRKRRQASSSSDSSSGESEVPEKTPVNKVPPPIEPQATGSSPSPSLSSSSPSSSDSGGDDNDDDDDDAPPVTHPASSSTIPQRSDSGPTKARDRHRSPSPPSPPPANAPPPFLPSEGSSSRAQDEQALRNRFRQFWMASVADGFADDLDQIRQVRRLSQTQILLSLLFSSCRSRVV